VCQHLSFISNGKATEGKSRSKPDPGNLAVRDCRGACRNMLHGLITICHEVGNDGYRGSYWPKAGVRYISISTIRIRFCCNFNCCWMILSPASALKDIMINSAANSVFILFLYGKFPRIWPTAVSRFPIHSPKSST